MLAMRDEPAASPHVLDMRYCFKVRGIDTQFVSTEMIEF